MRRVLKPIVSLAVVAVLQNVFIALQSDQALMPFLLGLQSPTGSLMIRFNIDEDLDLEVLSSLEVFINGMSAESVNRSHSKHEFLVSEVPTGECHLVITGKTIEKIEERLIIQRAQQTVYAARIRRALVKLTVTSEPGARVSVNHQHYAEVPPSGRTGIISFPPCECVITLEHPDFDSESDKRECLAGDLELEFKLKRKVFSPEFSDDFAEGARFWSAPEGWHAKDRRLGVRGTGIGLLRERVYKNFIARLTLSLDDRRGAAWVVRALDKENGYLFQLTGPLGTRPNLLRTFVREKGETRLLKSDPVIDDLSRLGDTIEIIVEARGETVKHFIKVSSAPKSSEPEPLSVLVDKTFSTGTFGLETVDSEEFTVFFFTIIPLPN